MKRLICLVLCAVLVLSLCACGESEKKSTESFETLHVGFGRESIMPEGSVPLGGYGNTDSRMSNGFLDILYGTCIAFSEGDQTVLLFSQDAIRSQSEFTGPLRELITKETGIPGDRIMVTSTHTHSAPDFANPQPSIQKDYRTLYMQQMLKAAKAALADRKPATLYGTSTKTEGLNFVRHFLMNDGTYAGDNFGNWGSGIKDYAAENDPEMCLVKIDREGDAKDILMMNWQCHPSMTGGSTEYVMSADFIGACRTKFESDHSDMYLAYFQGAAGNESFRTQIAADAHGLDYLGYGQKLAEYATNALPNMQKIDGKGIETIHLEYEYGTNRGGSDKLVQAQEVVNLWESTGSREQGNALAYQYGINSVYEASAIIGRQDRPEKGTIILDATRIGNMAFINTPYEMFSKQGLYIKENSPFDMTLIITMSNDAWGYFPSEEAYAYGCYESYGAFFESGVAEYTADQLLNMLKELKK